MNHADLFFGISGFALAAEEVWGKEYNCIRLCDNNEFCQHLLKKHSYGGKIYGDIRTLSKEQIKIDLLTGGFPCQPFSCAGKRRGTEDDRFLWPEMHRVIRDFKPTWVIAENVRGILTIEQGMVFEQVCLDLEGEGYEVQPFIIPACAVNAPHRRDRVWIVAHRNVKNSRLYRRIGQEIQSKQSGRADVVWNDKNASNPKAKRLSTAFAWMHSGQGKIESPNWDKSWVEVATELCGMDDGLSVELDGFKLTKSKHRIERLKALGNAIVPQVAVEIMKAIKESR